MSGTTLPNGPEARDYALTLSDDEVQRYRTMAEVARTTERAAWERAGIVAGARVADVGCGPGAISLLMAEAVGPTGRVVAIDADPGALDVARALSAAGPAPFDVRPGNADDTGLDEASVDVAVVRHVLAHNGEREQAVVDHLATRVRPGGAVYLVDVEISGHRRRPADPDIADLETRYAELHRRRGNDLAVGLRLDLLLRTAGLEVEEYTGRYVIVTPLPGIRGPAWAARDTLVVAGLADDADLERWDAALDRAPADSTLFLPQFTAVGRRPG